jgi:CRISPR-associated protein Cas6
MSEMEPVHSLTSAPCVVVSFPLQGRHLPADHGYALYSAITRHLPALHGVRWLGIELISGLPQGEGMISLPARGGRLGLRIPADRFGDVLTLAGKRLVIGKETIRLGIPSARPLTAASAVYSRIVTIKRFTEPEEFVDAARRQLEKSAIKGNIELPIDDDGRARRRVLAIKGKTIVGFSLAVHDLNEEDSLRLMTLGLGGRRSMGCGIFNPIVYLSAQKGR